MKPNEVTGTLALLLFGSVNMRQVLPTTEYRVGVKEDIKLRKIMRRVYNSPVTVGYYSEPDGKGRLIQSFVIANKTLAYWTINTLVHNNRYVRNRFKFIKE